MDYASITDGKILRYEVESGRSPSLGCEAGTIGFTSCCAARAGGIARFVYTGYIRKKR
jgi:hypothetical protein